MTQRRLFSTSMIAGLAASAALILPGAAMADNYWHPDHFRSSKTRDQVRAEAAAAVRESGASRFNSSAYPAEQPQTGGGKTREEVVNELLTETPAQREARLRAISG